MRKEPEKSTSSRLTEEDLKDAKSLASVVDFIYKRGRRALRDQRRHDRVLSSSHEKRRQSPQHGDGGHRRKRN